MDLFLRGLAIGFVIAAGFGPIGLLCVRRTLDSGFAIGFATGLGAATADAAYAAVAALGGAAIGPALVDVRRPLAVAGGIVLVALGIRAWTRAGIAVAPPAQVAARDLAAAWLTTFGLTLANPMTVLSFAAAFAALAPPSGDVVAAAAIVAGVAAGSTAWWLILAGGTGVARRSVSPRVVRWLRVGSALLLVAFGVVAIASAIVTASL
jgi:putative LysE/RhtB family amino acid efflux pump